MESDFSTTLIVISPIEKIFVKDNCIIKLWAYLWIFNIWTLLFLRTLLCYSSKDRRLKVLMSALHVYNIYLKIFTWNGDTFYHIYKESHVTSTQLYTTPNIHYLSIAVKIMLDWNKDSQQCPHKSRVSIFPSQYYSKRQGGGYTPSTHSQQLLS